MTSSEKSFIDSINFQQLFIRAIPGAIIGLGLIIFFLATADKADPAWGRYWMIRPLLVVPIAAGGGSAFSYFLEPLRKKGGWKMVLALLLSVLVFVIALWLGIVVGLDGTYWN